MSASQILPIFLSVPVVGTVVWGVYATKHRNANSDVYLLVKKQEPKPPYQHRDTNNNRAPIKYECKFDKKTDYDCALWTIPFDETKKSIDIAQLKQHSDNEKKRLSRYVKLLRPQKTRTARSSEVTESKINKSSDDFFLLKTKQKYLTDFKQKTLVVQSSVSQNEHSLPPVTLDVLGQFDLNNNWNFIGSSGLFIAKFQKIITSESTNKQEVHKCYAGSNQTPACYLSSEVADSGESQTDKPLASLNFSTIDLPQANNPQQSFTATSGSTNKHYLIQLNSKTLSNEDISKNKTILVEEEITESSQKKTQISEFTIEALCIGELKNTLQTKEIIILK